MEWILLKLIRWSNASQKQQPLTNTTTALRCVYRLICHSERNSVSLADTLASCHFCVTSAVVVLRNQREITALWGIVGYTECEACLATSKGRGLYAPTCVSLIIRALWAKRARKVWLFWGENELLPAQTNSLCYRLIAQLKEPPTIAQRARKIGSQVKKSAKSRAERVAYTASSPNRS